MTDRVLEIAAFLGQQGWDKAQAAPFDGDFSPRRYARLTHPDGRTAILMDADEDQKTPSFVGIARLLKNLDISAPNIFAANPARGLVLMEDFGNQNFGRMIDEGENAIPLYRRAVDVLVHLHTTFSKTTAESLDLPLFDAELFARQVDALFDAYFFSRKGRARSPEEGDHFRAAWHEVLQGINILPQTLLLRDFMPDNMMNLPERSAWRGVGVLDFQDAGLGPPAYDLASLCEVVRRDGGDALRDEVIGHYHREAQPDLSINALTKACRILSAQRHMRILGLIATLAGKHPEKRALLPRVTAYLSCLLAHDELKPVHLWVEKNSLFS